MAGFVAYFCVGIAEAFAAVRVQAAKCGVQAAKRRTTAPCFGSLIPGSGVCWTCSGVSGRRDW
jgi:hypothetical protein